MALLQGDVLRGVHDLVAIVQLILFLVAAAVRLPRVAALLRERRIATAEALLLNVEEAVSPRAAPYSRGLFWLRAFHLACCASLLGIYVALLAAPPPGVSLLALLGQVAGAVMWGLCTLLVVAEARARAHSGRSLRVWWMLNLVAASYHLYFDLDEARSWLGVRLRVSTDPNLNPNRDPGPDPNPDPDPDPNQARSVWPHPRTALLLQLAGFLPSLLLGLAAAFEPVRVRVSVRGWVRVRVRGLTLT